MEADAGDRHDAVMDDTAAAQAADPVELAGMAGPATPTDAADEPQGASAGNLFDAQAPDATALAAAAAVRGRADHYNELLRPVAAPGAAPELQPLWQRFFGVLGTPGWVDLEARMARVQRRLRDDGATYNVYAEGHEQPRTWPLELLPFLIGADEWARIERGVIQRARLLDAALADIYGEQTLLQRGLLPSQLVYAHAQYLRPMQGVKPAGGHWLHVVGVDIARGEDGLWWVVGHRTQAPSGMGYLLENRLIIAQQFSAAFRELKVQRLASSFQAMLDGLLRASPAGARSRVALLTPGPHNETYFEHVFLARYLGLTLVEGSDLTVRDQRLYLKTLHGLERVHVLLRRVDDEWLDPLELRNESQLGVPGLLQAVRAGELVLGNAPGAGLMESPGLSAFWPSVCRKLLGEELLLPAATSWWCGEAAVWKAHRARLAEFVVAPTFPPGSVGPAFEPVRVSSLDAAAQRRLLAAIDADPAAYTLLEPMRPSEQPVWRNGRLEPCSAVVRVYAVADGSGGWRMLPGGLTRVDSMRRGPALVASVPARPAGAGNRRSERADAYLSMQRGSASADTWVLTDGVVDPLTLLPRPLAPADLVGWHRPITSRAAENLFWLGRYTERAETTVRLARLTLEALPAAHPAVMGMLHSLAVRHGLIGWGVPSPVGDSPAGSVLRARAFERALVAGLGSGRNGKGPRTSVGYNLHALRVAALALRERLSPEHWSLIDQIGERFERLMDTVLQPTEATPLSDVLEVLALAGVELAAITGAQTDRMTRDDGWRLLSVGRMVERLDMLSHALALGFERDLPSSDDGFALLLGLFDSTITYRAQFQARREVPPLLHLLVLDTDNPRSLAWVARTMRERLRKLARHNSAWADAVAARMPAPEEWPLAAICRAGPAASDGRTGAAAPAMPAAEATDATGTAPARPYAELLRLLDGCSTSALALSDEISRRLFSHVANADHQVWQ
jgi:uncharacterized circularly permuted ATP-grasp superfamily protein/uncharacterized alpha-E superfamily protein